MPSSPDGGQALSVSTLTQQIRGTLERDFGAVWVTGEISNLARPASGHMYLSLKDDRATLRAVIYRGIGLRLRFDLRDGMEVLARGRVSVYDQRGDYQLVIEEVHPKGIGALELALQQLKEKLRAKGYFNPERKRPLPRFPTSIALVTSSSGAAVRDMLELLARRWPQAAIAIVPVRVQGEGAAEEIAAGIDLLNRLQQAGQLHIDAMVVGRGGGSVEDLWAFNLEVVADAIYRSQIPVISAVGHEIDVTIADFVADHRALTPSHAVTDLTPDRHELTLSLLDTQKRLLEALRRPVVVGRQRLDSLVQQRPFRDPLALIRERDRQLDDLSDRLQRAGQIRLQQYRDRFSKQVAHLEALSPLKILARGYSLTQNDTGTIVRQPSDAPVGTLLRTRLAHGAILSRVESLEQPKDDHDANS